MNKNVVRGLKEIKTGVKENQKTREIFVDFRNRYFWVQIRKRTINI